MELVAKLLQAVLLIAGLLWSGICVAQCRVLPKQAAKITQKQSQKKLPPCHQQHENAPVQEDCKDETCSVSYADAEKSFQVDFDLSIPLAATAVLAFDSANRYQVVERRDAFTPPSRSISVLRI